MLRLKRDTFLLQEYDQLIRKKREMGVVEVSSKARHSPGKLHYIPHHPAFRRDKQRTKVHIVYDASAKTNKVSLNSCLHTGPSLIPRIIDVLIRFRCHKITLVPNVEKAFH